MESVAFLCSLAFGFCPVCEFQHAMHLPSKHQPTTSPRTTYKIRHYHPLHPEILFQTTHTHISFLYLCCPFHSLYIQYKQQGLHISFTRRSCNSLLYIFITITKPDPEAIRPRPSAPVDTSLPKDSRLPRPVPSVSENVNNSYARELEKVARQLRVLKATNHAQDDEIVRLSKENERLSGEAESSQETVVSYRDRVATSEAMLTASKAELATLKRHNNDLDRQLSISKLSLRTAKVLEDKLRFELEEALTAKNDLATQIDDQAAKYQLLEDKLHIAQSMESGMPFVLTLFLKATPSSEARRKQQDGIYHTACVRSRGRRPNALPSRRTQQECPKRGSPALDSPTRDLRCAVPISSVERLTYQSRSIHFFSDGVLHFLFSVFCFSFPYIFITNSPTSSLGSDPEAA